MSSVVGGQEKASKSLLKMVMTIALRDYHSSHAEDPAAAALVSDKLVADGQYILRYLEKQ